MSQRKSWPVEKVSGRSPTVADIEFDDFEFEQFAMSRHGPSAFSISDQPSKGTKYFVTPTLNATEAITTVKFEAVDEHGTVISVIPMLQTNGSAGDPFFYGVMLVPDRPFRILASKAPITYRVYVRNSDFEGVIEQFYSHNELYNNFVADGAVDCGPEPTIRF